VLFDCQSFGIWNNTGATWEGSNALQNYCESHNGWNPVATAGPDFSYGTPDNQATNLVWATRTGRGLTQTVSQVDWMRVWLSDRDDPGTPTMSPDPPSSPPWEDRGSRGVNVTATDGGLGMKRSASRLIRVIRAASTAERRTQLSRTRLARTRPSQMRWKH
jgi:hypothetical protein